MCKSATVSKALLAIVTVIRFLFGVTSDVTFKIASVSKALLTQITLIWFFSSVGSDVAF